MKAFLMFLIFLGVARHVHGDCPKPTGKENMDLITNVQFPAPEGTSVNFKCQVGYNGFGSGTVTCSNGQWSNLELICKIKNCGSADEVANGRVNYDQGTEFGAIAYVECNEGYNVVGIENRLLCGSRGWEGRLGFCEATMCDSPNQIANGHYSPEKDDYRFSEVVTYSCNEPYKIKGSRHLVCSEKGQFDKPSPTCVLVDCPNPQIEFGTVASGSRPPYTYLTSVTFQCSIGYHMVGLNSVTCDIDSKWSPELPTCKPIECKAPGIQNGVVVDGRLTYNFSDTVTLKCSEGYKLTGNSMLTCGATGQWSGTFPECKLIQCTAPEVDGGVLVNGSRPSYEYKDSVVFTCLSGHNMTGESIVTCDLKGQWSPKLPVCTSIRCKAPEVKHGELENDSRPSYEYLNTVTFKCKSGYTMKGTSTLTCGINNQWSPELPQCTTNDTLFTSLITLGALSVASAVIGVGVYFGLRNKEKGSRESYTEAPKGETVEL